MKTIKIEFTQEEAIALLQLVDIAVKSGGMKVAQASVVLYNKISDHLPKEEVKEDDKK